MDGSDGIHRMFEPAQLAHIMMSCHYAIGTVKISFQMLAIGSNDKLMNVYDGTVDCRLYDVPTEPRSAISGCTRNL